MTWTAFAILAMFSCSKRTYGTDSWFIIQSDWRGNVRASDQITSVFLEYNLQQKTFFIFFSLSWHCVHTVHVLVCCTSLSHAKTWTLSSFVLIIYLFELFCLDYSSNANLNGRSWLSDAAGGQMCARSLLRVFIAADSVCIRSPWKYHLLQWFLQVEISFLTNKMSSH